MRREIILQKSKPVPKEFRFFYFFNNSRNKIDTTTLKGEGMEVIMEINCSRCGYFGKCDFFPALTVWTGSCQFKSLITWEKIETKHDFNQAVCEKGKPVFFREFSENMEKVDQKRTIICENNVCSKKSWCNDEIAKRCRSFVAATKTIKREEVKEG